jgi:hypothetical protein
MRPEIDQRYQARQVKIGSGYTTRRHGLGATGKHIDGQSDYFNLIKNKALAIEVLKQEKGC